MAQVSFTISAIDRTRAAFTSINAGLRNMVKGGDAVTKRFLTMGLQLLGVSSVLTLVGAQVRRLATNIEEVPGVDEDAIRSWQQLKARMDATSNTLGVVVAKAGEGINSLVNLIRFGAIAAVDGLAAAQDDLLANERALTEQYKISSGWYDRLREQTDRLMQARRNLMNVDETDGASISRRRAEAAEAMRRAEQITDEIRRTEALANATELRVSAEKDFAKLQREHASAFDAAGRANAEMLGITVSLTDRIEGLRAAWMRTAQALAIYNDESDPQILERRNELLKEQAEIARQITGAVEEQARSARQASNILTDGFENAVFAGEGLRETLRGIGLDLARYVFAETVTKKVGDFLTGGIQSILGFRATGGPVNASTPYVVGESGPELFVPSQAGRIVPNHEMGSGRAGGNTYYIDARGTDESVVQRLSATLLQLAGPGVVERRAKLAVFDARTRGALA